MFIVAVACVSTARQHSDSCASAHVGRVSTGIAKHIFRFVRAASHMVRHEFLCKIHPDCLLWTLNHIQFLGHG